MPKLREYVKNEKNRVRRIKFKLGGRKSAVSANTLSDIELLRAIAENKRPRDLNKLRRVLSGKLGNLLK